ELFPSVDGCRISLWDTAGEERFLSLSNCYYRDADAVLLLYSAQSQLSFDSLPHWVCVARQYCPDGREPGATPAVRGQRGPSSQSPLCCSRLCSLPVTGSLGARGGSGQEVGTWEEVKGVGSGTEFRCGRGLHSGTGDWGTGGGEGCGVWEGVWVWEAAPRWDRGLGHGRR
uniref:Uncharacterized protein n=1 Tax=Chelonoidis abingdonii TaxID=106734 RepID=A0A8C0H5Q5_CHEAB